MRYLQSVPQEFANTTPTSLDLIKFMVAEPDLLPYVRQLYRGNYTPFSSLLADKGLTSKGLFEGLNNKSYRVTSSNVVQYAIQHSNRRKLRFKSNGTATYVCDAYPTTPGKNQSVITIFLDGNWFSPKDVLELKDWQTKLYVVDEMLPEEVAGGVWAYKCKLNTNVMTAYVDTTLMEEGNEIGFVMTMFEHDLSKTGYEKYTFDGWGRAYMTLQRMKYSYSGTAAAMKGGPKWTIHNGQKTWISKAADEMLERWAEANEYQLLFGTGTVSADGDVLMHDLSGREILAGDGICNQGDGSLKIPYQKWTTGFLHSIMKTMQLRAGSDGVTEVALIGGQEAIWGFQELMNEKGIQLMPSNIVTGAGAEKGINATYSYYEFGGVRIIPTRYNWFDNPDRPVNLDANGVNKNSFSCIMVSLGNANNGDKGVELLQLRPPKMGAVSGIDVGGEKMSNSIDGTSHHILAQTGIVLRNLEGIAELYKR